MDLTAVQGVFNAFPIHWFFLGGFFVVLVLDSLRKGTARATALALALPFAGFLTTLIPQTAFLKDVTFVSQGYGPLTVFGTLFLVSYFLFRRMGIEHFESGIGEPIQSLMASLAASVVLILVWVHTPALSGFWTLGEPFSSLFAESYRLFWLLGSYLALAFARG